MTQITAGIVVGKYNCALEAKDFVAARGYLTEDLHFEGPIDWFEKADDYIGAITRLYGMVKGVEHEATIVEGDDVAVFYVRDTPIAKAPVAEWYRVRKGKIESLRAYFDARPFVSAVPQRN